MTKNNKIKFLWAFDPLVGFNRCDILSSAGRKRCFSTSSIAYDGRGPRGVKFNLSPLRVNSDTKNIVFKDGKAILKLAPLKPFKWEKENMRVSNNKLEYINGITTDDYELMFQEVFNDLSDVTTQLFNRKSPFYVFEFYFYVNKESKCGLYSSKRFTDFYTQDSINKDCFNKIWGQFGYTTFTKLFIKWDDTENSVKFVGDIILLISLALEGIWNDNIGKHLVDVNKDTLLVIHETNEENLDKWHNKLNSTSQISDLSGSGFKRNFSTISSHFSERSYNSTKDVGSKCVIFSQGGKRCFSSHFSIRGYNSVRSISMSGVKFNAFSFDMNNPNLPKHLYINSTTDKIVFEGDTAVLMLPPFIEGT